MRRHPAEDGRAPRQLGSHGQTRCTHFRSAPTRTAPIGFEQLRQGCTLTLRIHLLRCLESYAEQVTPEDRSEHVLETADHCDRVEIVEEAKMGDAEELSFHLAL